MADYTRDIGGGTTLMIRDHGNLVEFWVRTGSQSWNNEQPWSFGANGGNSGTLYFRLLRGGGWQKMGQTNVGYDQTVRFTIFNSGLGFPTYDFYQHIQRTTTPGSPHIWDTTAISSSFIRVQFTGGYDGGSPILEWQIAYSSNGSSPEGYWGSGGFSEIGPFNSGERKYFWARGRNALGWGAWSNRTEASTWRIPDAPYPVTVSEQTQTSTRTHFNDAYNGGTDILERQLGYGLDPDSPTHFAGDFDADQVITDLEPGRKYYFWARVRNSVGWSPWSGRRDYNLVAGARVLFLGTWKRAVPYVRVNGVWRVAEPWVKVAGVWKETSV